MLRVSLVAAVASVGFLAGAQPSPLEALGAKVTVSKGVVTQASVNTDALTPEQFRTLGAATTLKRLSTSGKGVTDATLPLLAGHT